MVFVSIFVRCGCCFLSLSKASAFPAMLRKRKIITAVEARVTRQLNAVALSTALKLMFAEAEGRGSGLITGGKNSLTER